MRLPLFNYVLYWLFVTFEMCTGLFNILLFSNNNSNKARDISTFIDDNSLFVSMKVSKTLISFSLEIRDMNI